jgi:hypothetical protein
MQFESISLDFQFQRTSDIEEKLFKILYAVPHTMENILSLICIAAGDRGGRRRCDRPGAGEGHSPPRNYQSIPV